MVKTMLLTLTIGIQSCSGIKVMTVVSEPSISGFVGVTANGEDVSCVPDSLKNGYICRTEKYSFFVDNFIAHPSDDYKKLLEHCKRASDK